jgi:hypothetical protein
MLERLKQLFAPKRRGPEVEIEAQRPMGEGPADLPVGPMVQGVPPVVPVERDAAAEEPDEPRA